MTRLFLAALLSACFFSSCSYISGDRIKGSGNVITQARTFSGYTKLETGGAISLFVKQDSLFSVKVETDDNLQQYVLVEQDGNTLRIKQKDNTSLDVTGKIKVYVSAPAFEKFDIAGASQLTGENILTAAEGISIDVSGASYAELEVKAPEVAAEMRGASSVNIKGETKDLHLEGSGASHAKCFELLSENADVDVAGASSAEVFASVKLEAEASGASHIRYKGNATVNSDASGAGSVKKVE